MEVANERLFNTSRYKLLLLNCLVAVAPVASSSIRRMRGLGRYREWRRGGSIFSALPFAANKLVFVGFSSWGVSLGKNFCVKFSKESLRSGEYGCFRSSFIPDGASTFIEGKFSAFCFVNLGGGGWCGGKLENP